MKKIFTLLLLATLLLKVHAVPENNPPTCPPHSWSAPVPCGEVEIERHDWGDSEPITVKTGKVIVVATVITYIETFIKEKIVCSKCGAESITEPPTYKLGLLGITPSEGVTLSYDQEVICRAKFDNPGTYTLTNLQYSNTLAIITVIIDDDDDGLSNSDELTIYNTNPYDPDSDDDGLTDYDEVKVHNTDPNDSDSDNDGMPDNYEVVNELNPNDPSDASQDKDNDGLSNLEEYSYNTNLSLADTDNDGLSDGQEVNTYDTNPNSSDSDSDGLNDGQEVTTYSTDPNDSDSDNDGITDGTEISNNLDPTNNADANLDSDGDGLTNITEIQLGTNPQYWDSDGDLLSDSWEVQYGLNPNTANDTSADSDNDGLTDFNEFIYNSNPNQSDTDGDGTSDGAEVTQGSDPTDASDEGQAPADDKKVEIKLTVGDHSGSHSERWNLIIGQITHCSEGFGIVSENTYKVFKIGKSYEASIKWVASNSNPPDYDYTATIQDMTLPANSAMWIADENSILGQHDESSYNYASGKTAYMHLVGQEAVKNTANAKGSTDEDSLANKIVINLKASELIRSDVEVVLCDGNTVISDNGVDCIATLLSDADITNYGLTSPTEGKLYAFDVTKVLENGVETIKVQNIPLANSLGGHNVKFRFKNDPSNELHGNISIIEVQFDLDIDSDNNAWVDWSPDVIEDNIENSVNESGKIIITNEGCESLDGKPDYANLSARLGETNLVPMRLSLNTTIPLSKFKIKFEYEGESTLTDGTSMNFTTIPTAVTGDAIANIPFTTGKNYSDYTVLKKNKLRVWAGLLGDLPYTAARKANKFGTKSDAGLTDPDGNYLAPVTSVDDAYSAELLFNGQSGPDYTIDLWVEGINPADVSLIKATLLYQTATDEPWDISCNDTVKVQIFEGNLTVNIDNDKDFDLTIDDDKLEDQNDGFNCWYSSRLPDGTTPDTDESRSSSHGLENMFPLKADIESMYIDVPLSLFKYYIKIEPVNHEGSGILCGRSADSATRLLYLKDDTSGTSLLSNTSSLNSLIEIEDYLDDEYLFGLDSTGEYKLTLYAEMQLQSQTKPQITIDTCKITARDIKKYFWFGSCRGSTNVDFDYPTEDNREVTSFDTYPNVSKVNGYLDNYDINKDFIIFLHGFNVVENEAVIWGEVMFRRLYWTGYRGNLINITWDGDYGWPNLAWFDTDVYNALRSSRSILNFIETLHGEGVANSQINIAAHSLGNLVMWDALRLYRVQNPSNVAINNAISIEGAVWREAFFPKVAVEYTSITDPGHEISYSTNDLMLHSWAFWFQQPEHKATDAASNFINSYTSSDSALEGMKTWAWLSLAESNQPKCYDRSDYTSFRTPNSDSLPEFVGLMKIGFRDGVIGGELEDPIGLSTSVNSATCVNASLYNWRQDEHSDSKNLPLYTMYGWFEDIFVTKAKVIK